MAKQKASSDERTNKIENCRVETIQYPSVSKT